MPKKRAGIKLTDKEKRFAEEYPKSLDARKAAEIAGFSKKSANVIGCQLKQKPEVAEEIQKQFDARSERTKIDQDYVINTIVETIERCKQGVPVEEWDPIAKEMVKTGEWKFEPQAVLKGADLLGKHLKLWDQSAPVTVNINLNEMSDEQIEAEIASYEKRLKK